MTADAPGYVCFPVASNRNSKNQSDVGQDSVSSNSRKYLICLLSVTPPRVTTFLSQACEKRYQSQHVHYRMKWIGLLCVSASQNSVRKPTDVLVLYVLSCVCSRFWIDVALVSRCCHNVFYRLQNNRITPSRVVMPWEHHLASYNCPPRSTLSHDGYRSHA